MEFFNLEDIVFASTSLEEVRRKIRDVLLENNKPQLWLTFNLDFLRIISEDKYFYNICKNSNIVLPDGAGILHLLRVYSNRRLKRITGNDILITVLELSFYIKIKAAFVGSTSEVISKLDKKIRKNFPNLIITETISPPLDFENDTNYNNNLVKQLKIARPDVLFMAIGTPRQEIWLYENMQEIGAKINVGVGAAFDFFTGEQKRSPKILQNLSLEWFWRLLHEPNRLFRRYIILDLPFFIKMYYKYKFKNAKN